MKDILFFIILLLFLLVNLILTIKVLNNQKKSSRNLIKSSMTNDNTPSLSIDNHDIVNNKKIYNANSASSSESSQINEKTNSKDFNKKNLEKIDLLEDINLKQKVNNSVTVTNNKIFSIEDIALKWWLNNIKILEEHLEDIDKIKMLKKSMPNVINIDFNVNQNMVYIYIKDFKDMDHCIVAPILYTPLRGNFDYFLGASSVGQVEKIKKPAILKALNKERSFFSIIAKGELECG